MVRKNLEGTARTWVDLTQKKIKIGLTRQIKLG